MKIIGLTGGIGTGKTSAASILARLGAAVIDADSIGHQVLDEKPQVRLALVEYFGPSILLPDGRIDRQALAGKVFGNPGEVAFLNSLVHPLIRQRVEELMHDQRQAGCQVLVIDAPLLIEAGWTDLVNAVWVVTAPVGTVLRRLEKKGMPRKQALERMQAQMPEEQRRDYASATIENNTGLAGFEKKITTLFRHYMYQ